MALACVLDTYYWISRLVTIIGISLGVDGVTWVKLQQLHIGWVFCQLIHRLERQLWLGLSIATNGT